MKAKFVNENIEFNRGRSVKKSMAVGVEHLKAKLRIKYEDLLGRNTDAWRDVQPNYAELVTEWIDSSDKPVDESEIYEIAEAGANRNSEELEERLFEITKDGPDKSETYNFNLGSETYHFDLAFGLYKTKYGNLLETVEILGNEQKSTIFYGDLDMLMHLRHEELYESIGFKRGGNVKDTIFPFEPGDILINDDEDRTSKDICVYAKGQTGYAFVDVFVIGRIRKRGDKFSFFPNSTAELNYADYLRRLSKGEKDAFIEYWGFETEKTKRPAMGEFLAVIKKSIGLKYGENIDPKL